MHQSFLPRRQAPNPSRLRCERLEDRIAPAVAAEEQLFVYMLNRARHDPVAYQMEQSLPVLLSGIAAQPPLAVNDSLFDSTEFHAQDMADRDYFDHNTPEGLTPNEMVRNAGYTLNDIFVDVGNNVESIAAGNAIDTATEALNLLLVDAGVSPPAHRMQLLAMLSFWQDHREIGVGHGFNLSSFYDNYWSIHTAYTNPNDKFLTGVVFNDLNSNHRYDLNEGLSGVTVSVGGQNTTTNAAGGWSIKVAGTGNMTVNASGGGFSGTGTANIGVASNNIEIDFISGESDGIVNFNLGNSAPVLNTALSPTLPTITEDNTNSAGAVISTFATAGITDADPLALKGIAVTGVDNSNGQWQYSAGAGWQNFGAASDASARLLRDTDRIRFVPAANFSGTATFTFRAWDRTSGAAGGVADVSTNGGKTAFSADADSAGITVTSLNDAPVLAAGVSPLPAINVNTINPAGVTIEALTGAAISDADPGAVHGIAIIGSTNGASGVWQYSTNGGSSWNNLGGVSASAARLLDANHLVRFVPAANYTLTSAAALKPTLTFRAWDETKGAAGATTSIVSTGSTTAFSSGTRIAIILVNDAPTLSTGSVNLPAVAEDALTFGATVSSFANAFIGDTGTGTLKGIAVTSVDNSNGTWQYFTGLAWTAFGSPSESAARLLRDIDRVRFIPAANFNGTATFTFRAWDRTIGTQGGVTDASATGGTTAFSTQSATGSITVNPANDAPVLAAGSPMLPDVIAGDANPAGVTVATLVGGSISDADAGALQGIAIIGQTGTINGTWQFSTDGGANWSNIGAASAFSARLLADSHRIRFLPKPTYTVTTALSILPSITFRAWDQTSGVAGLTAPALATGGKTAFSIKTQVAKVRVNAAPTLAPATPNLGPVGTGSPFIISVASLLGSSVTDVGTGVLEGIAVTGLSTLGSGHWQYSIGGGAFIDFGAVSDASARLLRATDCLRYVPQAGQTGSATITFRAWDQTTGFAGQLADASTNGGASAFSLAYDTATLSLS